MEKVVEPKMLKPHVGCAAKPVWKTEPAAEPAPEAEVVARKGTIKVGDIVTTTTGFEGRVVEKSKYDFVLQTQYGKEQRCAIEDIILLNVTISSARGLRDRRPSNKDVLGQYCTCEIEGKPSSRAATKALNDTWGMRWDCGLEIIGYAEGDKLIFSIWDSDTGRGRGELVGRTTLTSASFHAEGFDGELLLHEITNGDVKSYLQVNVEAPPKVAPDVIIEGITVMGVCCC